jgi:hypothetical protein
MPRTPAVPLLTYGGIKLVVPTPEICDFAAKNLPVQSRPPFGPRSWPGTRLTHVSWPTAFLPDPTPEPGRLVWPVGASRWAYGGFFCSANRAEEIRTLAYSQGPIQPLPFVSKCGTTGEVLTTSLYLLEVRPLSGIPEVNGLCFLTLVDIRYYWQWIPCPAVELSGGALTWAQLIDSLASSLGVPIVFDSIHADYGKPHDSLELGNEPLPIVLDTVAYNVGMRFVRRTDGVCSLQSAATAYALYRASRDREPRSEVLRAGGEQFAEKL